MDMGKSDITYFDKFSSQRIISCNERKEMQCTAEL